MTTYRRHAACNSSCPLVMQHDVGLNREESHEASGCWSTHPWRGGRAAGRAAVVVLDQASGVHHRAVRGLHELWRLLRDDEQRRVLEREWCAVWRAGVARPRSLLLGVRQLRILELE